MSRGVTDEMVEAAMATYHRKLPRGSSAEENTARSRMHAALTAALAAEPGAADGMVLVPREPSMAMQSAGLRAIQDWEDGDPEGIIMDFRWLACWKAMLAAAPRQSGESGNG